MSRITPHRAASSRLPAAASLIAVTIAVIIAAMAVFGFGEWRSFDDGTRGTHDPATMIDLVGHHGVVSRPTVSGFARSIRHDLSQSIVVALLGSLLLAGATRWSRVARSVPVANAAFVGASDLSRGPPAARR